MYLRSVSSSVSSSVSQRRAPHVPRPVAEGAGGRVPRVLALAWLGLTHRAHRADWLRGHGAVAHGERDYRHTRPTGTRERRPGRLRRRGRERRPLRPPGLLARLLGLPLCRHLLQPREERTERSQDGCGLRSAPLGGGEACELQAAAAPTRTRGSRPAWRPPPRLSRCSSRAGGAETSRRPA